MTVLVPPINNQPLCWAAFYGCDFDEPDDVGADCS